MESMGNLRRTHYCGEVRLADAGQEMVVAGSIAKCRDKGGIIFADLRDTTGILQLVFDDSTDPEVFRKAGALKSEYVAIARGLLRERDAKTDKIATGAVELYVTELRVLSGAETTPFEIRDEVKVKDELRLKYRYLDLRRPCMHEPLVVRSKICQLVRNYFCENHFCEIETPMLMKSTPEGARDYLVPSRVQPGHFYALPQSPQLYKQILMLSGFDRYFQIARCFRDEDLRADRQPEFTQIDVEMSFVTEDDVIGMNEGLIKTLWKEVLGIELATPFTRLSWDEAMARFGSDKPDTRFGLELMDVTDAVKSCRDLAKRREILKDSHVGSFAVIGVVLLILCQFAFCVSFNQKTDIRVLIVIPVVSRCGSALAVALLPKMSTSQYVRKQAKAADIWIPCAFLAGAITFAFSLRFRCGLVLLVQAAGYGLALRKAYRSLEGMNGDISGYALTLSELSALGALAIL